MKNRLRIPSLYDGRLLAVGGRTIPLFANAASTIPFDSLLSLPRWFWCPQTRGPLILGSMSINPGPTGRDSDLISWCRPRGSTFGCTVRGFSAREKSNLPNWRLMWSVKNIEYTSLAIFHTIFQHDDSNASIWVRPKKLLWQELWRHELIWTGSRGLQKLRRGKLRHYLWLMQERLATRMALSSLKGVCWRDWLETQQVGETSGDSPPGGCNNCILEQWNWPRLVTLDS